MNNLTQEEIFVKLLERCKYFEFTDEGNIEELKDAMELAIQYEHALGFRGGKKGASESRKFYYFDSEILHKENGFETVLKSLKPGLDMVCDFVELAEAVPSSSTESSLEASVVQFVRLVNAYFWDQKSKYRFYPVFAGSEGAMMILNEAQFLFLNKEIQDKYTRPLSLMEWQNEYINPDEVIDNSNKYQYLKVEDRIHDEELGMGFILSINGNVAEVLFRTGERTMLLKLATFKGLN